VQVVYAAMVLIGALIGQRWGVGGVAVAVSIAMGINWLWMAALGRSVTGLSWPRFLRAQVPGALFALLIGVVVAVTVQAPRAAHLGGISVLVVGALTAAVMACVVWRARSELFLGPHGAWAATRVEEFSRLAFQRFGGPEAAELDGLAEGNSELDRT
jgi:PST family polysaccharide transporter